MMSRQAEKQAKYDVDKNYGQIRGGNALPNSPPGLPDSTMRFDHFRFDRRLSARAV